MAKVKIKGAVRWPRPVAKRLREAMALRRDDGPQQGGIAGYPTPTESPEAVTRPRLPQVACGFTAL